ncbi:NmrA multi-domain protein [Pyrenophora tritici-repentis]|nr:NmrA multi-domain protein [Pyrenophora tritici-repentis]
MAARLRVAVVGATGEIGRSVMDGLLSNPEQFKYNPVSQEVFALVRPASVNKLILSTFTARGAIVTPTDFGATDSLAIALTGIHIVISCLTLLQQKEEITLIEASSKAKVHRYVPSFFGPVCPPRGVMMLRERKEDTLDCIKRLYLPYTVIDVGWLYQLSLPQLPSGRIQTKAEYSLNDFVGDGDVPIALVDIRDIGKYVARIVADPQTLNKMVFAHGETWTQSQIFDTLEEKSGENIARKNLSKQDADTIISDVYKSFRTNPTGMEAVASLALIQYRVCLGIRGDNTVEHAKL